MDRRVVGPAGAFPKMRRKGAGGIGKRRLADGCPSASGKAFGLADTTPGIFILFGRTERP
jgi:hypothetical protein